MKNYLILGGLFTLLAFTSLTAQQDAQYTQFMNHKLGYNPAFAGAEETSTFILFARQQWMGLEGAPSSQIITYNTPFSATGTGLGLRIQRLGIGLENRYTFDASYAYRIQLRRGARLGIGISASARQFSVNFQEATPIQGGGQDGSIPPGQESKLVPNFGFGIYFDSPNFYLGVSAPRLLENNIDFADDETIISRQVRHFYAMTGLRFALNENVSLFPQALFKVVSGAPFDADFNLTGEFGRNLSVGASYRMGGSSESGIGESLSGLLGYWISNKLQIGLTYDIGLSELRSQHSGSLEVMIRYAVGGRSEPTEIVDPRSI